ncbi:hypothetical protein HDU67_006684 [Dinochytrium kinnereticum]|nr:hypothetical protein HDU67_006684 [Dinochytrium kinnereticum]
MALAKINVLPVIMRTVFPGVYPMAICGFIYVICGWIVGFSQVPQDATQKGSYVWEIIPFSMCICIVAVLFFVEVLKEAGYISFYYTSIIRLKKIVRDIERSDICEMAHQGCIPADNIYRPRGQFKAIEIQGFGILGTASFQIPCVCISCREKLYKLLGRDALVKRLVNAVGLPYPFVQIGPGASAALGYEPAYVPLDRVVQGVLAVLCWAASAAIHWTITSSSRLLCMVLTDLCRIKHMIYLHELVIKINAFIARVESIPEKGSLIEVISEGKSLAPILRYRQQRKELILDFGEYSWLSSVTIFELFLVLITAGLTFVTSGCLPIWQLLCLTWVTASLILSITMLVKMNESLAGITPLCLKYEAKLSELHTMSFSNQWKDQAFCDSISADLKLKDIIEAHMQSFKSLREEDQASIRVLGISIGRAVLEQLSTFIVFIGVYVLQWIYQKPSIFVFGILCDHSTR